MAAAEAQARCMSGIPLAPKEVEEARAPALSLVKDYWARVAAADAADITPLFQESGQAEWASAGATHKRSELRAITDPVARRAGAAAAPELLAFVRAIGVGSARGVWEQSGGEHYLVDFRRRMGVWKISRIELFPVGSSVPQVTEYCREPGDVERERAREEERRAKKEARRAAQAAQAARAAQR